MDKGQKAYYNWIFLMSKSFFFNIKITYITGVHDLISETRLYKIILSPEGENRQFLIFNAFLISINGTFGILYY